jgi:WS/DGAT/MGAT family acyltransferase
VKVDRASTNDLVMLATEAGGQVPNTVGAVLVLAGCGHRDSGDQSGGDQGGGDRGGPNVDVDDALRVIGTRISGIRRLRQRLVRPPVGCGRPVWVDDPSFDVGRHLTHLRCPPPGDEPELLRLAAAACVASLPSSRPRWAAILVSGLTGDRAALILVLHHVLADGIGGLAVLAALVDEGVSPAAADGTADRWCWPRPTVRELFADAMSSRWQALRSSPAVLRQLPGSFRTTGGLHPPPAGDCSLLRRTGPRRQLAVARADLAALHDIAAAQGATVNDALLAAVSAALHELLVRRGETLDTFRVTVPVAGRQPESAGVMRNDASVLVVEISGAGNNAQRLRRISATVRAAREMGSGPSPAALVGPVFRVLAHMGAYRRYLLRQRRFHTIVSNVRGPGRSVTLAGTPIESIIPLSAGDLGNVTVTFMALSYAGTLTVTVIADPDQLPDLAVLIDALQTELDALCLPVPTGRPVSSDLSPPAP